MCPDCAIYIESIDDDVCEECEDLVQCSVCGEYEVEENVAQCEECGIYMSKQQKVKTINRWSHILFWLLYGRVREENEEGDEE